jgi:hypothetical protein
MSLETKIRELLEVKKSKALNEAASGKSDDGESMNAHMQGNSQKPTYTEIDPHNGQAIVKGDDSIKKPAGETSNPKQGNNHQKSTSNYLHIDKY